jgi:hypothetical protein
VIKVSDVALFARIKGWQKGFIDRLEGENV